MKSHRVRAAQSDSRPHWPVAAALILLIVVSAVLRLGTLRRVVLPSGQTLYYHLEYDERVFEELVAQVRRDFFDYSLRGTAVLREMNQQSYDQPIFFHPPAFVYAARALSFVPLPLVPVLLNLVTIVLVFLIGTRWYDHERALWAAFLVAACPVLWFISQKIWIDNMLILMMTASVAAIMWAADVRRPLAYAGAGAVFGLAFLSKTTAVLGLLPLGATAAQRDAEGVTAAKVAAFLVPVTVLAGWWELTLKVQNGTFFPSAIPNPDMVARFPFVAEAVARPWYWYVVRLITITPVYLLALGAAWRRETRALPFGLWFAVFWLGATAFGLGGGGYQLRYLAPGYPALALLAADRIAGLRGPALIGAVALVGYGMMNGLLYAVLDTAHVADFTISAVGMVFQAMTDVSPLRQ